MCASVWFVRCSTVRVMARGCVPRLRSKDAATLRFYQLRCGREPALLSRNVVGDRRLRDDGGPIALGVADCGAVGWRGFVVAPHRHLIEAVQIDLRRRACSAATASYKPIETQIQMTSSTLMKRSF